MLELIVLNFKDNTIKVLIKGRNEYFYSQVMQYYLQRFIDTYLVSIEQHLKDKENFLTSVIGIVEAECQQIFKIYDLEASSLKKSIISYQERRELSSAEKNILATNLNKEIELNKSAHLNEVLTKIITQSIRSIHRALSRVINFLDVASEAAFNHPSDVRIVALGALGGDRHNEGQTSLLLTLSNGFTESQIVYKPSTILIDFLLVGRRDGISIQATANCYCVDANAIQPALVSIINIALYDPNTSKLSLKFHEYKIFPLKDEEGEFGFSEFLHVDPRFDPKADAYWRGAGMVSAFATFFGLADVHQENLLQGTAMWLLIDLENSLLPIPFSAKQTCLFNRAISPFDLGSVPESLTDYYFTEFQHGILDCMRAIAKSKFDTWISQGLIGEAMIRVVPFSTQILKTIIRDLIKEELTGSYLTTDDFIRKLRLKSNEQKKDLPSFVGKTEETGETTFNDEGKVELLVDDIGYIMKACSSYDVPAFYMQLTTTFLYNSQGKRATDKSYYVQSPLHGIINKLALITIHSQYVNFLSEMIRATLHDLNAQWGRSLPKGHISIAELQNISRSLYRNANLLRLIQTPELYDKNLDKKLSNQIANCFNKLKPRALGSLKWKSSEIKDKYFEQNINIYLKALNDEARQMTQGTNNYQSISSKLGVKQQDFSLATLATVPDLHEKGEDIATEVSQLGHPIYLDLGSAYDTHWYSDEEINRLMFIYSTSDDRVIYLNAMLGSNAADNYNILAENLQEFNERRNVYIPRDEIENASQRLIIPVNLNNNHWALLYIIYHNQLTDPPDIYYFDPLGDSIPLELEKALSDVQLFCLSSIVSIPFKLQDDEYNCGPWIIEVARAIIGTGRFPREGLDISQAREEHMQALEDYQRCLRRC